MRRVEERSRGAFTSGGRDLERRLGIDSLLGCISRQLTKRPFEVACALSFVQHLREVNQCGRGDRIQTSGMKPLHPLIQE